MNCENCKKETINLKYCSRSCAAKINNCLSPKRVPQGNCKLCNIPTKASRVYCKACWDENKHNLLKNNSGQKRNPDGNKRIYVKKKTITTPYLGNGEKAQCKNCDISISCRQDFCSIDCWNLHKEKNKFLDIDTTGFARTPERPTGILFIKKYMRHKFGDVCSVCSNKSKWNDKPLVLILDHIDGNCANWKVTNLRLVCPNCDSQLPTFKSKNKNSQRKRNVSELNAKGLLTSTLFKSAAVANRLDIP